MTDNYTSIQSVGNYTNTNGLLNNPQYNASVSEGYKTSADKSTMNQFSGTESMFKSEYARVFTGANTDNDYEVAKRAAEEMVSNIFIKPIFSMMRNDPLKSDLVAVSSGEKTFGPMLDGEFAKNIVNKAHFPLIDAVASSLLRDRRLDVSA